MSDEIIEMQITPIDMSGQKRTDDTYDNSTADLINYGLRHCGLQSEYDLANKLQEMRKLALFLTLELKGLGYPAAHDDLKLIDVMIESSKFERLHN